MGVGIGALRAHALSARLLQHCTELCVQSEVSTELGQGPQTPVQKWKTFADEIFLRWERTQLEKHAELSSL